MGQFDLNLSTRPFRAYRVANLGLFALLLILIAVSVVQFYSYQRYSSLAAATRDEERIYREEADRLSEQTRTLNLKMGRSNATAKLSEVEQLNQLLLRKSFSWTRLLAHLEKLVPEDVRLVSLQPVISEQGKMYLNMNIRGRSLADATQFLRALENSKVFQDVTLAVEEKKGSSATGEVEFMLSASYNPGDVAK
jgi:Tfp pilus assembly protein PilN